MTDRDAVEAEARWRRLAGFLFIWLIVTGLGGTIIMSRIAGAGTFVERAGRVISSQHWYALGLMLELVETASAAVLGFALYVILRPFGSRMAQLALCFRLGESFLGAIGVVSGFCKLRAYTAAAALGAPQAASIVELTRAFGNAATNVGAVFFSIGSLLFFLLFLRSPYIPRTLAYVGVVASPIVTVLCIGSAIFPEHAGILQFGWAPMAVAEVGTGVCLMLPLKATAARER